MMRARSPHEHSGRLRGARPGLRGLAAFLAGALLLAATPVADARTARPAAARAAARSKGRPAPPIPARKPDGSPNILSAAAVVVDLERGKELYAKNPDMVRPIASVGKIFLALAVREKGLPLDGETMIVAEDREWARRGARSRLIEGKSFKNIDLLRAMLIASDNRACTALGRAVGLSPKELVAAMNRVARRLGLRRTHFVTPSGLTGNVSTPREMMVGLRAALKDPVLREIMQTHQVYVSATNDPGYGIQYFSTNVSLRISPHKILGGKTGYTDPARYCLAIAALLGGRQIGMVFLGADGELTRFADFNRAADWLLAGRPGSDKARGEGKGAGGSKPKARRMVGAEVEPPPPPVARKLRRP